MPAMPLTGSRGRLYCGYVSPTRGISSPLVHHRRRDPAHASMPRNPDSRPGESNLPDQSREQQELVQSALAIAESWVTRVLDMRDYSRVPRTMSDLGALGKLLILAGSENTSIRLIDQEARLLNGLSRNVDPDQLDVLMRNDPTLSIVGQPDESTRYIENALAHTSQLSRASSPSYSVPARDLSAICRNQWIQPIGVICRLILEGRYTLAHLSQRGGFADTIDYGWEWNIVLLLAKRRDALTVVSAEPRLRVNVPPELHNAAQALSREPGRGPDILERKVRLEEAWLQEVLTAVRNQDTSLSL